jgi:hypothetical protein
MSYEGLGNMWLCVLSMKQSNTRSGLRPFRMEDHLTSQVLQRESGLRIFNCLSAAVTHNSLPVA